MKKVLEPSPGLEVSCVIEETRGDFIYTQEGDM